MLRHPTLEEDYDRAWSDWATQDQDKWENAVDDGLSNAAR